MSDYLLGHDATEWDRLAAQHALWRSSLLPLPIERHHRVLEVGCGSGALLTDLAATGATTWGLERDASAAAYARAHVDATLIEGDLYDAPLPDGLDWIVARWVFSFLPDVDGAVARMVKHLAPGGRLVIQDYNHEGLSIFPHHPDIWRVIEGFRAAYRRTGGDLWVAGKLPAAFLAAGLEVERVQPHAMAGPPDSAVWNWVERFLLGHAPNLVDSGELTEAQLHAFRTAWSEVRSTPGATLFSPLQVTVVGALPDRRG